MAKEQSFFFDSKNGDRKYTAGEFSAAFEAILTNGVIATTADSLKVTADGTGRSVKVNFGSAVIKGRIYSLKDNGAGQLIVTIPAGIANGATALIVARFSNTTADDSRLISIKAVATRSTTETEYDLVLAQVLVSNNIPQTAVTDTRFITSLCGIVGVAGSGLDASTVRGLAPKNDGASDEHIVTTLADGTIKIAKMQIGNGTVIPSITIGPTDPGNVPTNSIWYRPKNIIMGR